MTRWRLKLARYVAHSGSGRAVYFSRAVIPSGAGKHYDHVGMYTYRREALTKYVSLARGVLEHRESLEQLRAIEHGMRMDAKVIHTEPLGVDTLADLERARELLAARARTTE